MQPLEIQITGKADSAIAASRETEKALEKIIAATRAAGGETAALEQQLEDVRRTAANQWTAEYIAGLEALIAKESAAGNSTEALKQQLFALQAAGAKQEDFIKRASPQAIAAGNAPDGGETAL